MSEVKTLYVIPSRDPENRAEPRRIAEINRDNGDADWVAMHSDAVLELRRGIEGKYGWNPGEKNCIDHRKGLGFYLDGDVLIRSHTGQYVSSSSAIDRVPANVALSSEKWESIESICSDLEIPFELGERF